MDVLLVQDPNNRYDRHAIKVMMPAQVPLRFRGLQDNAGQQVGHVPANLCKVFTELINQEILTISDIKCSCTGSVGAPSNIPIHQSFSRHARGFHRDRPGGGAELKCRYVLTVPNNRFRQTMRVFEGLLTRDELELISC